MRDFFLQPHRMFAASPLLAEGRQRRFEGHSAPGGDLRTAGNDGAGSYALAFGGRSQV